MKKNANTTITHTLQTTIVITGRHSCVSNILIKIIIKPIHYKYYEKSRSEVHPLGIPNSEFRNSEFRNSRILGAPSSRAPELRSSRRKKNKKSVPVINIGPFRGMKLKYDSKVK